MTQTQFIENARRVHDNTYDYANTVCAGASKPLTITCRKHGHFRQIAANHLKGRGCLKCAGTRKKSTADFITEARKVHGDKFDYSKTVYKNRRSKISVICREHGSFEQNASRHLHGFMGCKSCISRIGYYSATAAKRGDYEGMVASLYIMRIETDGESTFFKIGVSSDVRARTYNIARESGYKVTVAQCFDSIPLAQAVLIERELIKSHAEEAYIPKAKFAGSTECFRRINLPPGGAWR